jgi:hypothetical protein
MLISVPEHMEGGDPNRRLSLLLSQVNRLSNTKLVSQARPRPNSLKCIGVRIVPD